MRAIDADELKKCVLKWLPQDPCGKEEKEMPFETDICVSMLMEIDEQPTIKPVIIPCDYAKACNEATMNKITSAVAYYDALEELRKHGYVLVDMREVTT